MQVTVYDRVPASANVSVGQVRRYLRRAGWIEHRTEYGGAWWHHPRQVGTINCPLPMHHDHMLGICDILSASECRQPSAVLADIAKEPT